MGILPYSLSKCTGLDCLTDKLIKLHGTIKPYNNQTVSKREKLAPIPPRI